MKEVRHYNLIFPLFITIFLPPFIFIPLVGNLLIDGLIYYMFLKHWHHLPEFTRLLRMVLPAWIIGFVVDVLGAGLLIAAAELLPRYLDLIHIWNSFLTVVVVVLVIMLVGLLIFLANRWLLARQDIEPEVGAFLALAMGIITAPWFFLIPTSWFRSLMGPF